MSLLRRRVLGKTRPPRPVIRVFEAPEYFNPRTEQGPIIAKECFYHKRINYIQYDNDASILLSDTDNSTGIMWIINPGTAYAIDGSTTSDKPDNIMFDVAVYPASGDYYPYEVKVTNYITTATDLQFATSWSGTYGNPGSEFWDTSNSYHVSAAGTGLGVNANALRVGAGLGYSPVSWNPGSPSTSTYEVNTESIANSPNAGFRITVVGFDDESDPDNYVYVDVGLYFIDWYVAIEEARHYYTYDSSFNRATYDTSIYTVNNNLINQMTDNGIYTYKPELNGSTFADGADAGAEGIPSYLITTTGGSNASGNKNGVLGTYTLVSGSFGNGASYFQGLVGKGVNNTTTNSNYYSSGSDIITVFTYDMSFTDLPAGSVITRVYCEVNGHAESTSATNEYMCVQLISGNTELSPEFNFKTAGTSNTTQTLEATVIPSRTQIAVMKLKCRLGRYGGAINGATCYVQYTYNTGTAYGFIDNAPIMTRGTKFTDRYPVGSDADLGVNNLSTWAYDIYSSAHPGGLDYTMDLNSCIAFKVRMNTPGIRLTPKGTNNTGYLSYVSIPFSTSITQRDSTYAQYFIDKDNPYERSMWVVLKNHRGGKLAETGAALTFNIGGAIPTYNNTYTYVPLDASIRLLPYHVIKFQHVWSYTTSSLSSHSSDLIWITELAHTTNTSSGISASSNSTFLTCGIELAESEKYGADDEKEHLGVVFYNTNGRGIVDAHNDPTDPVTTGACIRVDGYTTHSKNKLDMPALNTRTYFGNIYWFKIKCYGTSNTSTNKYYLRYYQVWGSPTINTSNTTVVGKTWTGTADSSIFTTSYSSSTSFVAYTTKRAIGTSSTNYAMNGYNPQTYVVKFTTTY